MSEREKWEFKFFRKKLLPRFTVTRSGGRPFYWGSTTAKEKPLLPPPLLYGNVALFRMPKTIQSVPNKLGVAIFFKYGLSSTSRPHCFMKYPAPAQRKMKLTFRTETIRMNCSWIIITLIYRTSELVWKYVAAYHVTMDGCEADANPIKWRMQKSIWVLWRNFITPAKDCKQL